MNRRVISILIVLAMMLALFAGCGVKDEGTPDILPEDQVEGRIEGNLEDLVDKIYETTKIDQQIAIETNPLDLDNSDFVRYNLGLEDVSDIEEAVVSEALITTQAYSMVLTRVKEGGNAEETAKEIREGIDPQKWVCVFADDVKVVVYGDIILLVMINSGMKDVATSATIMTALNEIAGFSGKEIK